MLHCFEYLVMLRYGEIHACVAYLSVVLSLYYLLVGVIEHDLTAQHNVAVPRDRMRPSTV